MATTASGYGRTSALRQRLAEMQSTPNGTHRSLGGGGAGFAGENLSARFAGAAALPRPALAAVAPNTPLRGLLLRGAKPAAAAAASAEAAEPTTTLDLVRAVQAEHAKADEEAAQPNELRLAAQKRLATIKHEEMGSLRQLASSLESPNAKRGRGAPIAQPRQAPQAGSAVVSLLSQETFYAGAASVSPDLYC